MPTPYLPQGLKLDAIEGTGEVQTPLHGKAADGLRVGDHVYSATPRPGSSASASTALYLSKATQIVDEVPTYRGEGQCFL